MRSHIRVYAHCSTLLNSLVQTQNVEESFETLLNENEREELGSTDLVQGPIPSRKQLSTMEGRKEGKSLFGKVYI